MFQSLSLCRSQNISFSNFEASKRLGEFTLIHSVGLLDSEDPFFVKIGLSRLQKMIRTENGAKRVIEASGVDRCLRLLHSNTDDPSDLLSKKPYTTLFWSVANPVIVF